MSKSKEFQAPISVSKLDLWDMKQKAIAFLKHLLLTTLSWRYIKSQSTFIYFHILLDSLTIPVFKKITIWSNLNTPYCVIQTRTSALFP